MTFRFPRQQQLRVWLEPERARYLNPAAAVIVANAATRTHRGEHGFVGRHLPVIVGRGEIVEFGANEPFRRAEERSLDSERIPNVARTGLDRYMTADEGVVEALVLEDRRAEVERRHEPVDRCEPVLAIAEIRRELEAPGRFSKPDAQDPLTVSFDEIETRAAMLLALACIADCS